MALSGENCRAVKKRFIYAQSCSHKIIQGTTRQSIQIKAWKSPNIKVVATNFPGIITFCLEKVRVYAAKSFYIGTGSVYGWALSGDPRPDKILKTAEFMVHVSSLVYCFRARAPSVPSLKKTCISVQGTPPGPIEHDIYGDYRNNRAPSKTSGNDLKVCWWGPQAAKE